MSQTITILGSTGSIGIATLRVIKTLNNKFVVYGLTCYNNLNLLEKQIQEFNPVAIAIGAKDLAITDKYKTLKKKYNHIEFLEGEEGIIEISTRKVNILLSAIVGAAGLKPSIAALPNIERIAIANKETLVMAGDIFIQKVKQHNVELIPVDSEHSAIFSLIENIKSSEIKRLIITASGGSLRERPINELSTITPEEALAHPTWEMGKKITIDSATFINKGLEVIESHHLFNLDYNQIDVIIHPESIIHSMVETIDGAIHAYLSVADMALPIIKALTYPEKKENPFEWLDLARIGSLNFYPYNNKRFPALELCYHAGRTGGTMPTVLNAANEIAVNAFLNKKIKFTEIVNLIERTMGKHKTINKPNLSDIFQSDQWARKITKSLLRG